MRIVILEDDLQRREVMLRCLRDRFPQFGVEFFKSACKMIYALEESGIDDVILISLDHDLIFLDEQRDSLVDLGDGVDVANWLTRQAPQCPVIVHTTNQSGGDRMVDRLTATGWVVSRVVPYGDTEWISERWRVLVRDHIVHGPRIQSTADTRNAV